MFENLIIKNLWLESIKASYFNSSELLKSGVVMIDNNSVFKGGTIISDQAFFNKLSTRMQRPVKGEALATEAFTMGKENMVVISRATDKIFYAQDLRRIGITDAADSEQVIRALDEILGITKEYLGIETEMYIWNTLAGVLGSLASTHVHTAQGVISWNDVVTAKNKLGKNRKYLTDFFCVSDVLDQASKNNLTEFKLAGTVGQNLYNSPSIETIAKMAITETSLMLANPDDDPIAPYSSYLFAKDCIYFAPVWTDVSSAYYPEKGGGELHIVVSADFAIHVPGVSYTLGSTDPTDAELAASTSWTRKAHPKNIKMVKLITQGE